MAIRKIYNLVILFIISVIVIPAAFTTSLEPFAYHSTAAPMPTPASGKPPYNGYKGVLIGITTDEARAKLGEPKEKSDAQDFYLFSENESALVYYDAAKTVTAVTVTYVGNLDAAPTAKAVFGENAEVKPDGGIFKMVRYPKAGFWISYNKIAGDDPLVIIAMQKF